MFTKKICTDIKKSTIKIQDYRKDSLTRLKHLKMLLEFADTKEAKLLFEKNYSHVYFVLYDSFIQAEFTFKHKAHKDHREELEGSLWLLKKIICLLPELLSQRWQCNSLSRIMLKLLFLGNSFWLRKEGLRYFIMWYQVLSENAPNHVHELFAGVFPGILVPQRNLETVSDKEFKTFDLLSHPNMKVEVIRPVFHDTEFCPAKCSDGIGITPFASNERNNLFIPKDDLSIFLNCLVQSTGNIKWNDSSNQRDIQSLIFILNRFKELFLPAFFPNFDATEKVYEPKLMPASMCLANKNYEIRSSCVVVLIKWIARFVSEEIRNSKEEKIYIHDDDPLFNITESKYSTHLQEKLMRDALYSTQSNINFIHEVFKQGFLLNLVSKSETEAVKISLAAYKSWITSKNPQLFNFMADTTTTQTDLSTKGHAIESSPNVRVNIREPSRNFHASLQNLIKIFVTNAANVFLIYKTNHSNTDISTQKYQTKSFNGQTEICKKVLNVYRTIVMNSTMDPKTWEQLLLVLLQIISYVFIKKPALSASQSSAHLDEAIFQTLVVSWIRAHTNVPIKVHLWEQFLGVFSSLTSRDALINEWKKTMQTMTRVLGRYVYNLNLQDLPLDRVSDNISKRRRVANVWQTSLHDRPLRSRTSYENVQENLKQKKKEKSNLELTTRVEKANLALGRFHSEGNLVVSRQTKIWVRQKKYSVLDNSLSFDYFLSVRHDKKKCSSSLEIIDLRGGDFKAKGKTRRRAMSLNSFHIDSYLKTRNRKSLQDSCTIAQIAPRNVLQLESLKYSTVPVFSKRNDAEGDRSSISSSENRSIILGGYLSGWLPVTAAIMWKRMLSSLGDINLISDPEVHSRIFEILVEISMSMIKIVLNQGFSADNSSTPTTPSYVPPIGITGPWCYGAHLLGQEFVKGKLSAVKIICMIAFNRSIQGKKHFSLFHNLFHRILTSGDCQLIACLVKSMGNVRFLTLFFPGQTLLFLNIINVSSSLVTTFDSNLDAPHEEVIPLLGSLLCYPLPLVVKNVLAESKNINLIEVLDIQDHVLNIMLLCANRDTSSRGRCIAFAKLGEWIYLELNRSTQTKIKLENSQPQYNFAHKKKLLLKLEPRIEEAIEVLFQALYLQNRTLAIVAAGSLRIFSGRVSQIQNLPKRMVTELCTALEVKYVLTLNNPDKVLISTLIMGLGELCMSLPVNILLCATESKKSCNLLITVLSSLFNVLSAERENKFKMLVSDNDVDNIQDDNLGNKSNERTDCHMNKMSIRQCAKSVVMHLVNNINLFPRAIGASRYNSLIEEDDDISILINSDNQQKVKNFADVVDTQRHQLLNPQVFILKPRLLTSFIEIPIIKLNSSGLVPIFVPIKAVKQVRVLLRDLNGKYCWESSILYSEKRISYKHFKSFLNFNELQQNQVSPETKKLLFYAISSFDIEFLTVLRPSLRRRRQRNELPIAAELASDLDQLGDLLYYISDMCPECFTNSSTPYMTEKSTLGYHFEAQTISKLAHQRIMEKNFEKYISQIEKEVQCNWLHLSNNTNIIKLNYSFQLSHSFLSHLGLIGWEMRHRFQLLKRNEKLKRELRNIDKQKCRDTHKVAIVYVASGQEDKNSILRNTCGSKAYESFVSALGWEIDLETHNGFLGGLSRQGCGATAPYYATPFVEVIYHAATRMPSDSTDALLTKTRHLGNDEVHIVWSEHFREYHRSILPTEFCDVLIVVYPLENCLFRVTVNWKPDVPWFGPLGNESIVNGFCLAILVRETAINASRSKRSSLSLYQQYYEERNHSLENVSLLYKENSTFEEFARKVYITRSDKQLSPKLDHLVSL